MTTTEDRILALFSDLKFEEERHIYRLNGQILPSVTRLVANHTPKFEENKMAYYSSIKESRIREREVKPDELIGEWKITREEACTLGHNTHKFMENFTGIETPRTPQEEAGVKYIKDLEGKYRVSFRELRAYSREFKFAGTMDLPLEVIGSNAFVIDDYKTNNADLFKSYNKLYAPFEYLEASTYNKFQLQLNYYQVILEEWGLGVLNRRVVHLKSDGSYRIYELLDLTEEIRDHLRHLIKPRAKIYW